MTTTYYQEPYAAARPGGRTNNGHGFGYDGSRPPMPNYYLPPVAPQPAGPPQTSSALRMGLVALGAVVAVGAGALLGVALFGDGSDSTRPAYLVPRTNGTPAVVNAPRPSRQPCRRRRALLPDVTTVVVPPPDAAPSSTCRRSRHLPPTRRPRLPRLPRHPRRSSRYLCRSRCLSRSIPSRNRPSRRHRRPSRRPSHRSRFRRRAARSDRRGPATPRSCCRSRRRRGPRDRATPRLCCRSRGQRGRATPRLCCRSRLPRPR